MRLCSYKCHILPILNSISFLPETLRLQHVIQVQHSECRPYRGIHWRVYLDLLKITDFLMKPLHTLPTLNFGPDDGL